MYSKQKIGWIIFLYEEFWLVFVNAFSLTCLSNLTILNRWTPWMIDAWWNFRWTPRCFSSSFFVSASRSLPSTRLLAKASAYWGRPRSGSHSEETQVWLSAEILGKRVSRGSRSSSIANLNFLRCIGCEIPRPDSNSESLSSRRTWRRGEVSGSNRY